mmetsp:Transcript_46658/g.129827  ORF Transcript_46658/g.129827 Transcript_46658/m.129827 type:complete len:218 (-) Transcript_46658:340-993(-)
MAAMALPPFGLLVVQVPFCSLNETWPTAPMQRHAIVIPTALQMSRTRRPKRSTMTSAGNVDAKFTALVIVWKRFASRARMEKMRGPKYMKAFMPTSCCSSCSVTPRSSSCPVRPSTSSCHCGFPSANAFSWLSMISCSSWRASASSSRTARNASKASSCRPFCTSQRGERGSRGMASSRLPAGRACSQMAQRQPPSCATTRLSTAAATRMPKVIMSW